MNRVKDLKRLDILYVEDDESVASLMQRAIGRYFNSFQRVKDGEEGLKLFKNRRFDLIITDITMPKIDGLEMAKEIHTINPSTHIIVTSAYSDRDKLLSAIENRVIKYFIKPFDPEELIDYILSISEELIGNGYVELVGGYSYDMRNSRLLSQDGSVIRLSKREKIFIEALIELDGEVMSRDEIKRLLWNNEEHSNDAVRVFIKRVREKTDKSLIVNSNKEGYYIAMK